VKPELFEAMMRSLDLEKLAEVPAPVATALRDHGFDKVAAELFNVPEVTLTTAPMVIGQKLASRLASRRLINQGLMQLAELEKQAASFGTWVFGDTVGDHFRHKDRDLREARQYVEAGEPVPKHLAANKYVAKHLAKDARKAERKAGK